MKKIYTKILSISGNVISVKANDISYQELAQITSARSKSLAEVIRIEGDIVYLQVFSGTKGISTSDEVRFLGHPLKVGFSENILGRIFNGSGLAKDGKPPITELFLDTAGPSANPIKRVIPRKMVRTNIPMIDLFNTLVESQKIPIFSVSGEPYNELLARIALQTDADIIILGGIGLKHDEFLYFKNSFINGGVIYKSIFFMHLAADPIVEGIKIPDLSLAVAEHFALQNKRVLVLFSNMTNYADALKEIAITMEQVPSNRGYPGDLYSQLAFRYEKAVDFDGAGSITILAVTTMPGDDVTHPIPDNTGYITEGQFYLRNGRIEPFGSLSRLKQFVNEHTRKDHRAIMDTMIQLYAEFKETSEKKALGFKMSNWDLKLLKYGTLFENEMMNLKVNIPLEQGLDQAWQILSQCFTPEETSLKNELINEFWPKNQEINNDHEN